MSSQSYILGNGKKAHQTLKKQNEIFGHKTAEHLQKAHIKNTDMILEIGCGTGVTTMILVSNAKHVLAIDIDAQQIKEAKKNLKNINNVSFKTGDIMDPDFHKKINKKFDVIYARFVLMHLTNPEIALKNMFSVLKPGGKILLQESIMETLYTDPNTLTVNQYKNILISLGKAKGVNYNIGQELKDLCKKVGFQNIENYFFDFSTWDFSLIIMRLPEWGPKAIELGITTKEEIEKLSLDLEILAQKKILNYIAPHNLILLRTNH